MRKIFLLLIPLGVFVFGFLVVSSRIQIPGLNFGTKQQQKNSTIVYKEVTYDEGALLINDRNYFEDPQDFREHLCRSKELDPNCGVVEDNVLMLNFDAMDDSISKMEEIYYLKTGTSFKKLYVALHKSHWTCHPGRGHTDWGIEKCF